MSDLRVTFPASCSEAWSTMQSEGCNRHCVTCKTTVHDLSLLTIDDAERLLESGPLCVRAVVRSNGAVALKPSPSKATRRMVAALGASMSLATAACETGVVSPRMSIVGHLSAWDATKVEARSSDGRKHGGRIGKEGQFTIKNLFPGDYSVSFTDQCGRTHVVADVVVRDKSVDTGKLESDLSCIVVGLIEVRADKAG